MFDWLAANWVACLGYAGFGLLILAVLFGGLLWHFEREHDDTEW